MSPNSFFTDDLFQQYKQIIDRDFNEIPDNCIVVIPSDGLGTGLAMLDIKAPKLFQYILDKIQQL